MLIYLRNWKMEWMLNIRLLSIKLKGDFQSRKNMVKYWRFPFRFVGVIGFCYHRCCYCYFDWRYQITESNIGLFYSMSFNVIFYVSHL